MVPSARSTAPGTASWRETRRPEAADDLRDPAAHLTRAHHQDVLEAHAPRGLGGMVRPGGPGREPLRSLRRAHREDEREDDDPDPDFDRAAARLSALDDELARIHDAAGSR